MRIGIREQLAVLVLLTALVPLAVLAIATWVNSKEFISKLTSSSLSLTASLKSAQITSALLLIQSTCSTLASRVVLQNAIKSFYSGSDTAENWTGAQTDLSEALDGQGLAALLQVTIFSRNNTGPATGILNATATTSNITLPYRSPSGAPVMLGDEGLGYPAALYPIITYNATTTPDPADPSINGTQAIAFSDTPLDSSSMLLLGPLQINASFALLSLTMPIVDNSNPTVVLGYMTVIAAATFLVDVIQSREGLANTGLVLIVGPDRPQNTLQLSAGPETASDIGPQTVKFVFAPTTADGQADRHSVYNADLAKYGTANFTAAQYPAVAHDFSSLDKSLDNAGSLLSTTNENNVSVSVGYAKLGTPLVDWLLIVEQSHSEAWIPIYQLRSVVLACVFGAVGLMLIVIVPFVHYSIRPIRRLREATKKSIAPPGYTPNGSIRSDQMDDPGNTSGGEVADEENVRSPRSKKSFIIRLRNLTSTGRRKSKAERVEDLRRRGFRIPAKVQDRKHWIHDEITDLTGIEPTHSVIYVLIYLATFNAMSDELLLQYTSLESKVAARTQELEISKKAAEAANESKTLFIANISHELKTPLNGILGMCAVCMSEDDLPKIKRSLQVVYKSGDLLLHLLNDLLTFSKNQIGQQLSLDEREFHLNDIKTQILTIFNQQVQEGRINFEVKFVGADTCPTSECPKGKPPPPLGPNGMGRLKDMRFVVSLKLLPVLSWAESLR
jgi:osomolarity two-component system sensor histidine kinase SLN1